MTALGSTPAPSLAVDLVLILAAAGVVATLFRRFNLETIPGYLLAGAAIGPHTLGLVKDQHSIQAISDLAIILLMFGIGLQLDFGSLRRGLVHIIGIGVLSTVVFTAAAWVTMLAFGVSPPSALALAMATAMSSTAVLVRVLTLRREVRSTHGRITLGISIVQDLLSVVFMAGMPALAAWLEVTNSAGSAVDGTTPPRIHEFALQALLGLGGVALMLGLGRFLIPMILGQISRTLSTELMLVAAAAIALAAAIATASMGFSPEMGAFLAGLMLASTPYRYQLSGNLAPMRDLLMAVFFTTVGLAIVPRTLITEWWVVILGVLGVTFGKWLLTAATAWLGGLSAATSVVSGAYLANAGEFTLIVLAAANEKGVVTDDHTGTMVAIVILSLMVSQLLMGPSHSWSKRAAQLPLIRWKTAKGLNPDAVSNARDGPPEDQVKGHVIIAGFGPVGRALAERLENQSIPFTIVELNPKTVSKQTDIGRRIVYGDISNPDVLESAGIREADAVVLAIPDEDASLRACRAIRAQAPDVFIAARTSFLSQAFKAQQLGADHVTVEEIATAQAMEREVVQKIRARRDISQ